MYRYTETMASRCQRRLPCCLVSRPDASARHLQDKTLDVHRRLLARRHLRSIYALIARQISKYLPGNPSRIVENMPGAGGIITANHFIIARSPTA